MATNFSSSFKKGLSKTVLVITGLIASISICSAQSNAQTNPLLPAGAGAWTLQVVTRGGFDGQGKGDLWITSRGELNCSRKEMSCAREVAKKTVDDLAHRIATLTPAVWSNPGPGSLCPDCLIIMLRVTIRGLDGTIRSLQANWDLTTQGRLPEEILRLYNAASAVAK